MLIHGGGNSWWNYLRQARVLSGHYFVILPTLDGHGEESAVPYISTEDSADKLLAYIETNCNGHLLALCGVSLGGQIVMELLSRKADLAQKAIIDGSLCIPQPAMAKYCMAVIRFCSGLLFSRWSCRFQIAAMPYLLPKKMQYPPEICSCYLEDMPRIHKESLCNMYATYMMQYRLKESIKQTQAQIMYWYGEKEMKCVKESARLFQSYVPSCQIYEAKGYNHGYLSIYLPEEWLSLAEPFFSS